MKNKKSFTAVHFLIFLALGVFVFLILAILVPNLLGKEKKEITSISSRDYDHDGIADYFDKCPCDAEDDEEDDDGCPSGVITSPEECKNKIEGT